MHYSAILDFWFKEIEPKMWWQKDAAFDQQIQQRFGEIHAAATRAELYSWRSEPLGRLAEIIVLDQFSRNIYRDQALAFAWDGMALVLAQEAVAAQLQDGFSTEQKAFLFLPFMHSESALMHEQAVQLYSEPGLEFNLSFEHKHKRIIDRFGRYPHRNALLGRFSSAEEIEFLKGPDSAF